MSNKPLNSAAMKSALCITLAIILCGVLPSPSSAEPKDESFSVTVELRDVINPDFQTCIPVRMNEPFRIAWVDKKIKNSISGVLRPAVGDQYPLEIMILEGEYQGTFSLKGKSHLRLKLDEPFGWGAVFSIVYMRYVTLSQGGCK